MNLQVEPPEKKKRKRKTKTENSSSPPPSPPSFSLLPDEITLDCLARMSRSYYPTLSLVSKNFQSRLSSTELYAARSHLGSTEKCVYVCLSDPGHQHQHQHPQWFRLWTNPNQTLPNSIIKKKKKRIGQLLVPIPASNLPSLPRYTTVAVGAEIYLIGGPIVGAPSSAVRVLDCRSDTWRDAPSMNAARRFASACAYDGKIYVFGGVDEEAWGEVFDTKTQTWERLPGPGTEVPKPRVWRSTEAQGKIYVGDFLKNNVYDTKKCKWECGLGKGNGNLPTSEFINTSELRCYVYDVEDGHWKPVKGLDSLLDKYRKNHGSSGQIAKVVRCGEKVFVIWEGRTRIIPYNRKKIWCAEIELQKRHGGEIWGNVEWVDAVHTVPTEFRILHCHVVSV